MIRYKFLGLLSNLYKPERLKADMKQHSSKIQNILFSEDKMKTLMLICVTFAMTNAVPVINTEKFSHITEIERLGRVEEVVEEDNLIEDMMEEGRNCKLVQVQL